MEVKATVFNVDQKGDSFVLGDTHRTVSLLDLSRPQPKKPKRIWL